MNEWQANDLIDGSNDEVEFPSESETRRKTR